MKPSKVYFERKMTEKVQERLRQGQAVRLLELGCGGAKVAAQILASCPGIEYIGIEPNPVSYAAAKKHLEKFQNATVLNGLGYGGVAHEGLMKPFDVVFSLSVLEHVKDLPAFLAYAAKAARPGADVAHLYDLGHALYPSNLKERIQVALCNSPLRRFIPESKIACYLATEDVQRLLESLQCHVNEVTFHNMRSLVKLSDATQHDPKVLDQVLAFEETMHGQVADLKLREKLFPAVCFWTTKQSA